MNDLENLLRATLTDAEATAPEPHDLAERLIAKTVTPSRTAPHVVALRGRRVARRWLPPLLAAAVIISIITGGLIVRSALSSHPPAHHGPPAPRVKTPSVIHSTGAPAGFRPFNTQFVDAEHGWVVGNARCAAKTRICATLLQTGDGGRTWSRVGLPHGLVPVDDANRGGGGSCWTNGGIYGPCVDKVLFANRVDGVVYGHNFFFWTSDGGKTWHDGHSSADTVIRVGDYLLRARDLAGCSTCLYRIDRARVGSPNWTDVTPGHRNRFGAQLFTAGDTVYLNFGSFETDPGGSYSSTNDGASWAPVYTTVGCDYVAGASDGSTVADCGSGGRTTVRIQTRNGPLGPSRAVPAGNLERLDALSGTRLLALYADSSGSAWNVYSTTDGARTWRKVLQFPDSWFGYPQFEILDANTAYVVINGGDGINLTRDGGRTWHRYEFG